MISLSIRNPDDGISSYDSINIYSASSQNGTYTKIKNIAIDLSGATEFSSGFTSYTDNSGTTSTWYEFSYYNTAGAVETNLSIAIQGGTGYLDSRIRDELQDNDSTAPNYPFWTNTQVANARQDAVNALYPHYFKDWVDKSLTTSINSWEYTLPPGLFNVSKIEIWDQTATPYDLIDTIVDFDIIENKIRLQLQTQVALASGYTMYIFADKRITDAADCPSYMDEMLISKACAILLRQLLWDREKYQRYTTIIRPEGGNMPSIMTMIKYYEAVFANRRNEVKKGMPARSMTLD